ncbi:MAG TPA: DUF3987 domain-containing protein [Ktedonobacteraceae bacterium]
MAIAHIPDYDQNARSYLRLLKAGRQPESRPDFGQWEEHIGRVERIFRKSHGDMAPVHRLITDIGKEDAAFRELMYERPPLARVEDDDGFPLLPEHLHYSRVLADSASPWLNAYAAFSRKWSPRGYEGYHEAVGLSLLSALAGHRVSIEYGGPEYSPLYIALVGHTTLFKKTTTAKLYYGLLHAAGLDWMLGANITTPQKLLSDMAGKSIPANYDELLPDEQARIKKRLAMCAQRGWYYDEFGLHLDQMVKESGVMADFKGLLRIMDDCAPVFENATHSRGLERIEKPYLALLASMTPADIRPHAQKDSKFWKDGLFARFAFVCPPHGTKSSRAQFPDERLIYPAYLTQPIQEWHEWLGEPQVEIEPVTSEKSGLVTRHVITRSIPLMERECVMSPEVKAAIDAYDQFLLDMIEQERVPENLFGNYGRLHKLALRVAMLLASLENRGHIEIRHWAKGQEFAEARRRDLHELYAQVNAPEHRETLEDQVKDYLETLEGEHVTASQIRQYGTGPLRKASSAALTKACVELVKAGDLEKEHIPGKVALRFYRPLPCKGDDG